jgi:hypothetical protein
MVSVLTPPPVEDPIAAKAVEDHVHRLLQSAQFARAETQRKLLAYLWTHRHETVSEYAIATDALGRNAHFDSTVDASVRVHISRLRRKLKDYYAETGETELIVIPTGTHQLIVLEPAPLDVDDVLAAPAMVAPSRADWFRGHAIPLLGVLCAVLLVALAWISVLFLHQRSAYRQVANAVEQPNAFWQSFLAGEAPTKIVLPTPTFFNFTNYPWLKLRSTAVNNFEELPKDPQLSGFAKTLGPRGLEQSYTVTWDTLAAIEIARYLDRTGLGKRVTFDLTRDASLTSLEHANVIVLGTYATLQPMREYTDTLNFKLSRGEEHVSNAKPEDNEPKEWDMQEQGKTRRVEPSIIAVLPGRGPGLKVLMLESRDTSGMISLLCSTAGEHSVETLWRSHGSPQFFEMVVMTEREGNTVLRSWPVTMHAYTHGAPSTSL